LKLGNYPAIGGALWRTRLNARQKQVFRRALGGFVICLELGILLGWGILLSVYYDTM